MAASGARDYIGRAFLQLPCYSYFTPAHHFSRLPSLYLYNIYKCVYNPISSGGLCSGFFRKVAPRVTQDGSKVVGRGGPLTMQTIESIFHMLMHLTFCIAFRSIHLLSLVRSSTRRREVEKKTTNEVTAPWGNSSVEWPWQKAYIVCCFGERERESDKENNRDQMNTKPRERETNREPWNPAAAADGPQTVGVFC